MDEAYVKTALACTFMAADTLRELQEDSEIDDATEPSTTVATPQETATSAPSTTWTLRRSLEYRYASRTLP